MEAFLFQGKQDSQGYVEPKRKQPKSCILLGLSIKTHTVLSVCSCYPLQLCVQGVTPLT